MNYKLKLEMFEGPLDLLLFLIKKNEIDIYDIPIAEITQQYLGYIEVMKMLDLNIVGDYLVMAATLMQIKSKMLLPPDPLEVHPQEDPRDELVKRLEEYKKFKEIAEELKVKELLKLDLFPRQIDEEKAKLLKDEAKEVYFEASLFDLIAAFTKALSKISEGGAYEIGKEEYTVEEKIHDILHLLLKREHLVITELFMKAKSKMEMIVMFMAVLELIRLKEIIVAQKQVFGEIEIMHNKENLIPKDEDVKNEEPTS